MQLGPQQAQGEGVNRSGNGTNRFIHAVATLRAFNAYAANAVETPDGPPCDSFPE